MFTSQTPAEDTTSQVKRVGPVGLEPTTRGLKDLSRGGAVGCDVHVSYQRKRTRILCRQGET